MDAAQALVLVANTLAAICALGAAMFWWRFYDAFRKCQSAGKSPTLEWITHAANATAFALGLAGFGFLFSLLP